MKRCERGFSLIELLTVVVVLGIIFAFTIPAVQRLGQTHSLRGAGQDIVSQVELARTRAISSGVDQPIHFYYGMYGFDYHMHPVGVGLPTVGWNLPRGVTYAFPAGSPMAVTFQANGLASNALVIPLQNTRGQRDTVVVFASGQAFHQ